jgi:hypothetical protein
MRAASVDGLITRAEADALAELWKQRRSVLDINLRQAEQEQAAAVAS